MDFGHKFRNKVFQKQSSWFQDPFGEQSKFLLIAPRGLFWIWTVLDGFPRVLEKDGSGFLRILA